MFVDFPVEDLQGSFDLLARIFFDDFPEFLLAVGQLEADLLFLHALSQAGFHPLKEMLEGEGDIPW